MDHPKNRVDFFIMTLNVMLYFSEFFFQFFMGHNYFPKLNECSHYGDIHINCSLTPQYRRQHRYALLGKWP